VTCSAPPRCFCRHSSPAAPQPPHRRWPCVRADTNAPRTQCVCLARCLGATGRHSPGSATTAAQPVWFRCTHHALHAMAWSLIAASNLLLSGPRAQIPRTRADRPRHGPRPACTARRACFVEVVMRQPNCSLRIPPRKPSVLTVSSASLRQKGPMRSPGPCMPAASQAQRTLQTPTARPLCTCPPRRGIPSTLRWLPPSTPT